MTVTEAVTLIGSLTAACSAVASLLVAVSMLSRLGAHNVKLDHVEQLVNGQSAHLNQLIGEKSHAEGLAEGRAEERPQN